MKIAVLENNKSESDILKINFLGKVDELEKAHEAWLKERDYHVKSLKIVAGLLDIKGMPGSASTIRQAARFINEREV